MLSWFSLLCEHPSGIVGVHYNQARSPGNAQDEEESRGLRVITIETFGPNRKWPNLPNYLGLNRS